MILSDTKIIEELISGKLIITPLLNGLKQIGSSSVDVRLGTEFRYIKTSKQSHFNLDLPIEKIKKQIEEYSEVVHINPMQSFILHPGDFVLASTLEYFVIPKHLTGRLEGRSTWGRVGLQVHSTAGFVDPGFEGSLTFELNNMGKLPLPLYPGIRIGQLSLHEIEEAQVLYVDKEESKYGRITGTKSSMFFEDYEFKSILKYNNHGKN
ncbi:MAG: dCTP deaminase [Ignavibacteria bacterium]